MTKIYTFTPDEWFYLKIIKQSTEYLESKNYSGIFSKAIAKERSIFNDIIKDNTEETLH